MPKTPKTSQKSKFVDVSKDLCDSCIHAFKGGCPVWPTLNITTHCVMYKKRTTKK
jgi:hypothetical protein